MTVPKHHLHLAEALPETEIELKLLATNELQRDLAEHLEAQADYIKEAGLTMVSCLCSMRGWKPSRVLAADLFDPQLEAAIYALAEQTKNATLVNGARKLMRSFGQTSLFHVRRYPMYHPSVIEWKEELDVPRLRRTTWGSDCMSFLTWLHENYILHYQAHEIPLSMLSRNHVLEFRQHLFRKIDAGKINANTARSHLRHVIRWIAWLIDNGKATPIDVSGITIAPVDARKRHLPATEDLQALLSVLGSKKLWIPYMLYVSLLAQTGARPGEIEGLTFADLNLEEHTVRLSSKNKLERTMPVSDGLWETLHWYIQNHRTDAKPTDPVLVQESGKPLYYTIIYYHVKKACKLARVDLDGFHVLRHQFATDCGDAGIDGNKTRSMLGQSHLSSLGVYQHSTVKGQEQIRLAFSEAPWAGREN